jgi:hypothetical protein
MTAPKAAIANYFDERAQGRDEKAEQYPEDRPNARCADGPRELAAYIRSLPDDDERIMVPPGGSAQYAISRFRFYRRDDECDLFLSDLVELVKEDAIRQARDAGELPLRDEED